MLNGLRDFFTRLQNRPYYAWRGLLTVLFVGLLRAAQEQLLGHNTLTVATLVDYCCCYLAIFWGICLILRIFVVGDWRQATQAAAYGLLLGGLPPLVDFFVYGPGQFRYLYLFQQAFLFASPQVPLGETLAIWLAIVATGFYGWLMTWSLWRGAAAAIAVFLLLQVIGSWLPMLLRKMLLEQQALVRLGLANSLSLVSLALAMFLVLNANRFAVSLRRINHALPWFFVCLSGAELFGVASGYSLTVALAVLVLHWLAVAVNDYYDQAGDLLQGRKANLDSNDLIWLQTFAILLALLFALWDQHIGPLMVLYIVGTTAYHHHSIRLKQVCPINYKTEGFVAALAFWAGVISVGHIAWTYTTLGLGLLFYGGFALASMFKDYKDIDADQQLQIKTIYVVLRKRQWTVERIHNLVRGVVLLVLLAAVVLFYFLGASWLWLVLLVMTAVLSQYTLRLAEPQRAVRATLWVVVVFTFLIYCASIPLNLGQ